MLSTYLHSGRLDFFSLRFLVGNVSYCFYVHRLFFLLLPLYRFSFLFSVLVHAGLLFVPHFVLFLLLSFPLFSMSATGKVSNLVNTGDVDPSSIAELSSSVAHSPSMSPEV